MKDIYQNVRKISCISFVVIRATVLSSGEAAQWRCRNGQPRRRPVPNRSPPIRYPEDYTKRQRA